MDPERRRVLLVVGPLLLLVLFVGYHFRDRHYRVEYVVPDGFHGIFVVQYDPSHGTPPERNGDFARYRIPESGLLLTTDVSVLYEWHAESATYASGKKVDDRLGPSGEGHMLIGLIGFNDKQRSMTLIGTQAEAKQYRVDKKVWFEILRQDN